MPGNLFRFVEGVEGGRREQEKVKGGIRGSLLNNWRALSMGPSHCNINILRLRGLALQ